MKPNHMNKTVKSKLGIVTKLNIYLYFKLKILKVVIFINSHDIKLNVQA